MTEPHGGDAPNHTTIGRTSGEPQPPATPRWVKVAGIVVGLFVLAVLAKVLLGGGVGGHGPGMHSGLGSLAPPTSASSTALAPARTLPGL